MLVHLVLCALLAPAPTRAADAELARRLYTTGEAYFQRGRIDEALGMWRNTIVDLPQTNAYDELRHKLIMRLVYGYLVAFDRSSRTVYLDDAARLLVRYLERHEQLFANRRRARNQRGDVYEQMYEVDRRLEAVAAARGRAARDAAATNTAPAGQARDEGPPRPEAATHAGELVTEQLHRTVLIRRRRWRRPTIEDPAIRAHLAGRLLEAQTGLQLTAPELVEVNPARGFVRLSASPVATAGQGQGHRPLARDQRQHARMLLQSTRPALRRCYEQAFSRAPIEPIRTAFEIRMGADGSVESVSLAGAPVIDEQGTQCVRQSLATAKLPSPPPGRQEPMIVPLVFFWQPSTYFLDSIACSVRPGEGGLFGFGAACPIELEPNHGSETWMQGIDTWVEGP